MFHTSRPRSSARPAVPDRGAARARIARLALALTGAAALAPGAATAAGASSTVLQADPPASVRVAAGGGHVVAMEAASRGGSTLVELTAGKAPREIGRFAGDVAWPTVGRDAKGRAVVVLSPCLQSGHATPLPDCNLAVVDLASGASRFLPRSKGAYIGDLDGTHSVVARRSATSGVRVAYTPAGETVGSRPLALGSLYPATGYPAALRFVDSIDLSRGQIAATFLYGDPNGGDGGGSVLARRAVSGGTWTALARSTYGGASGVLRVFRAATVTATGIRAMFDGGDNEESYVGRWTAPTKVARRVVVEPTILASAAFDGDRLVTTGADGAGCGASVVACTVDTYGPLKLG